jgi:predicted transcriptional regulator
MRGRPKKEVTKDHIIGVRLNSEEKKILDNLCEKLETDPSDIIRRSIEMLYLGTYRGKLKD